MVTRLESLRAVSDLDATGYTQGAQQIEAANRRMERSQDDVTQAVSQTERRIQESTTAYDRFIRQLDPAAAAQARLAAQTERVNRWLEQGRITAEQHARAMQLLNQRYSTTATSAQRFASANDNAGNSGRNMGQLIGQAGFQIQDFASQVAAGQSALVAFAQQGSQLLGIFGTAGAIAGAVLTVGVLAAQLLGLGRSTKEAKSATDEFNEALRKSGEFLETAEERTRRLYEEKRKETQETLRSAAAIQLENIARAQAAEQRAADVLERLQADPRRTPDGARVNQSAIDQAATVATVARQRADEAATALGRLLDEYERVGRAQPEAERGIRGVGAASADGARADREWQSVLQEGERVRQSTLTETEKFAETQERLNDLLAAGAIDAVTYARALSAADPAVKAAAEARKQIQEVNDLVARDAQRERERSEREWAQFSDRSARSISDILYKSLRGGSFDFWELFRDLGTRAVADIVAQLVSVNLFVPAAQSVIGGVGAASATSGLSTAASVSTLIGFNPLSSFGGLSGIGASINGVGYSSGLFGIGAMNTPYGFSPAAAGLFGNVSATGFLGAAGIGGGLGYATGSPLIGGVAGGIGALALGAGPIGIGAAAGIGVLGGLLGRTGSRGDPYTQGQIALVDGRLVGAAAGDNNADPSGLQSEIDQGIARIEALRSSRGLVYSRGAGLFGDRTDRTFGQAFDEIAAGLRPGSGTGAATAAVLNSGRVTGIESLNALLGRADQFDTLSASLRATFDVTNQAEQQFAALSAQLDEAKVFADEFGISLQGVTAEMAGDFDEQIRRSILGITDANALALEDQDRTNAARLELAKKIGADINQVELLNGLERQQIVDRQLKDQIDTQRQAREQQVAAVQAWHEQLAGVADRMIQEAGRLRQEVDAALLGQYSPLSPEDRLALAQQRFASGQLGLDAYLSEGARAYGTATTAYSGFFYGALDQQRARAASMEATAASLYASLPGFATGGSFDVRGPAGNDNVVFAPGVRFQAGETVNVSRRETMAQLIERVDRLIALTANAGDQQIGELRGLRRQGASASAMVRLQAAR